MASGDHENNKRPSELYLVKDCPPETVRQMVAAEQLTPRQRDNVDRIRKASGVSGALIGAYVAEQVWDVRPVVLGGGGMVVLRASDPSLSLQVSDLETLRKHLTGLKDVAPGTLLAWGESDGQVWIARPRYEQLLSFDDFDGEAGRIRSDALPAHPLRFLREILAQVLVLHKGALSHGHLSRSNIAIVEGDPILVDTGCAHLFYSGASRVVNSEEKLDQFSDVYWTGQLIEFLLGAQLSAEHREFLNAMLETDPKRRPEFIEVVKAFCPDLLGNPSSGVAPPVVEPQSRGPKTVPSRATVKSGKFLQPGLRPEKVKREELESKEQPIRLDSIIDVPKVPSPEESHSEPIEKIEETQGVQDRAPLSEEVRGGSQGADVSTQGDANCSVELESVALAPEQEQEVVESHLTAQSSQRARPEVQRSEEADAGNTDSTTPRTPKVSTEDKPSLFVPIVLVSVLVAAVFLRGDLLDMLPFWGEGGESSQSRVTFDAYWSSGRRSQMEFVADSAVLDGDADAIATIVDDIVEGAKRPNVRDVIIKVGFSKLWRDELRPADKEILLRFALTDLVSEQPASPLRIHKAHPAVPLALVASLPPESKQKWLTQIPLKKLKTLPQPFGLAFALLSEIGVENYNDIAARCLTHVLVGAVSDRVIESYFRFDDESSVALGKLRILLPIFEANEASAQKAYAVLKVNRGVLKPLVSWFDEERIAEWAKVSTLARLHLVAGLFPKADFTFEQLADLLKFPIQPIKESASKELLKAFLKPSDNNMLVFLSSPANPLSRDQTVSLLAAFHIQGDEGYSLLARWFERKPSPEAVLAVLLARGSFEGVDPYSIDAARYLNTAEWSPTLDELKGMMGHREIMVRTVAYSKVQTGNPEHMKILSAAATVEPVERVRKQLAARVGLLNDLKNEPQSVDGSEGEPVADELGDDSADLEPF
jgi:hypothetical protein